MPGVTRLNDFCTGHDACPPRPQITGSENVFVNGRPCGRLNDLYASHSCAAHVPHNDYECEGAKTVYVNGRPAERIGDAVAIGGTVRDGSDNVVCGEWENGLRKAFTYTTRGKGKKTEVPPPFPVTDEANGVDVDPMVYARLAPSRMPGKWLMLQKLILDASRASNAAPSNYPPNPKRRNPVDLQRFHGMF